MVLSMILRGGRDERLTFLFSLLGERQYSSSDFAGEKVRPTVLSHS